MKKPRNKKYKKREIRKDAAAWAMCGAHKILAENVEDVFAAIMRAFDKFRRGTAGREEWNDIMTQLCIGVELAGLNIGNNLLPDLEGGQAVLYAVGQRMIQTGRSTCYAHELAAIKEAADLYRIQLQHCTQAELGRAHAAVKNGLISGKLEASVRIYRSLPP